MQPETKHALKVLSVAFPIGGLIGTALGIAAAGNHVSTFNKVEVIVLLVWLFLDLFLFAGRPNRN